MTCPLIGVGITTTVGVTVGVKVSGGGGGDYERQPHDQNGGLGLQRESGPLGERRRRNGGLVELI